MFFDLQNPEFLTEATENTKSLDETGIDYYLTSVDLRDLFSLKSLKWQRHFLYVLPRLAFISRALRVFAREGFA